jgi:ATP-dependent exoDNAse (exonuclease V) beta subunit
LTDPAAIERVAVTETLDPVAARKGMPDAGLSKDDALVGTLVHRLFQFASELPVSAGPEDVAAFTARLIGPDERATAADPSASVGRAIAVWTAMKTQPGVAELLESGDRLHELPFSCQPSGQRHVLRGTIDCLIRRPDGSLVIVEFKTGAPSPSHQAQLDVYLEAARVMFPDAPVEGRIVYAR